MSFTRNRGIFKSLSPLLTCIFAFGAVAVSAGMAAPCGSSSSSPASASKDVIDTAVGAGKFSTLAKALGAAGLVETLKGKGPFTVFAPDDDAFAKVPPDALNALLADKTKLTKVLTFHVVSGDVQAKKVVKLKSVKSLEGQNLPIKQSDGKVMIGDANVIATDIECSNGVIHVIDKVLMPQ